MAAGSVLVADTAPRLPSPSDFGRLPTPSVSRSLLPRRVDAQLRSLERCRKVDRDAITALRETVEAIWKIVEQAASESPLDGSRHGTRALLARRELVQRATYTLSAVIRRGVESGTFQPRCEPWAIHRLPFAIISGACVHWVFGLATTPSLRSSPAIEGALEVLRPQRRVRRVAVNILEEEP